MSSATPKTTATKGMKISFANTPQAKADDLPLTEQDGGAYAIDVLANDLGGAATQLWAVYAGEPGEPQVTGAPSSFAIEGVGTFSIVNGVVEFMPTEDYAAKINALGEGVAGDSFSFWYVIRLANGAFAKAQATITFEGVNDAAKITGKTSATIDEDGAASGTVTVVDPDTGENRFAAVDDEALETEFGSFTFDPVTGKWTFTPNDAADTLNVGDTREVTLTVTSLDGTATENIVVTITGTNDAAVVTGDATGAVKEDATVVATGKLTATDVDNDDGFQAVADGAGTYGTFGIDANGNWTYTLDNEDPAVQALTTAGLPLTDRFTFLTVDGTEAEVEVTINGTDEPVTVALLYEPAGPDVVVPGKTVNETYALPTQSNGSGPLPTGTSTNPLNNGLWGQWESWVQNLAVWRASFGANQDSDTTESVVTVYWRQGQQGALNTETIRYDNTFSYTTQDTTDEGTPASLIIVSVAGDADTDPDATVVDAFLFWNADTDLTFTGATRAQFEAEVTIGLLDVDEDGAIDDTVLMFTDGSTLTLFDAGFGSFAELFGSGQVTI